MITIDSYAIAVPMDDIKQQFVDVITEHEKIIHKICRFYLINENDKADLHQEIILQLWKSFPKFRNESKISTWIYRIALNTAISHYRKSKNAPIYKELTNKTYEIPEESNKSFEEDIQVLYRLISQLKDLEKAIILLYLENKSYEEISEIIGISKNNVAVKINRIKLKLKELFQNI